MGYGILFIAIVDAFCPVIDGNIANWSDDNLKNFQRLLNFWVIGCAILFGFGLIVISFLFVQLYHPSDKVFSPHNATAVFEVTPAATLTPTEQQQELIATLTVIVNVLPPEEEIVIGDDVEISGTSGDGLRIRKDPGLGGQVLFIASESERFQITEGPIDLDGYTWWYLVGVEDKERKGWGVANYLSVIRQ